LFITALVSIPAHAFVCAGARNATAGEARWEVDHYVYDSSLHRDWEVLVNCDRPDAPARIELAPAGVRGIVGAPIRNVRRVSRESAIRNGASLLPARPLSIKAGAAVEVSSAAHARASILFSGTATQSALAGQVIRVRLKPSGKFVTGIVRGPHSVELAPVAKPSWGKP
jgi:hypothetical protein